MKHIISFTFMLIFFSYHAQNYELKDKTLIKYYNLINEAEKKIINDSLIEADKLYAEAFKVFKYPHAKDLFNSMKVALKTNNMPLAFNNYQTLKCLGKNFDEIFFNENFKKNSYSKLLPCKNVIDYNYKKKLDSLYNIDQYYRNLSKGNYGIYKNELTRTDSITSNNLYKIIQEKGFPNEYNIGISSDNETFFHNFYFIIWHQLASNNISSQRVNFSIEINKALNSGKIRPDIAGFLLDLNNGTNDYSFFPIIMFVKNNGNTDCCYIAKSYFPENRNSIVNDKIQFINNKRKSLALPLVEDDVKKNIFYLDNKDYIFFSKTIEGYNFQSENDEEIIKKGLIKIK